MAVPQRTSTVVGVWAKNANTTIPSPPVVGLSYRNTNITQAIVEKGQTYKGIGDSAVWNQYLFSLAETVSYLDKYGIPPYSNATTYPQFSIVMWTDGKLYRAKSDVPKGTPPTNTTYWEPYIPDGIQMAPEITADAGITLYVDYTKSKSDDGSSAAKAFKNFTECFDAIRTKYAAANGMFRSYNWIPLFKIVANGNASNTIETGVWRFQSVNVEIQFQKNFTLPSQFVIQGSVVRLSGAGTFTVNNEVYPTNSTLMVDCNFATNNSTGNAFTVRNSNVEFASGKTCQLSGRKGLQSSGGFFNFNGTTSVMSTGSATGGQFVNSDMYIGGSATFNATGAPSALGFSSVQSAIRIGVGATCNIRQLIMCGGVVECNGRYCSGGAASDYGIINRGGFFMLGGNGSIGSFGTAPTNKGAAGVGGFFECGSTAKTAWPGSGAWVEYGGAYYPQ